MPLTIAEIESVLVARVGGYLVRVGMDSTTVNGTNPDLRDPIATAVRQMGLPLADPMTVSNADLVAVAGLAYLGLLDRAELRTLENIWGHWPEFDQSAGEESQSLSQLSANLMARIKELTERFRQQKEDALTIASRPGPSVHGLIRAGRCDPARPWDWAAWRACR